MIPFCNPIIEKKCSTVTDRIRANINRYAYFEIWMDYIEDLNSSFITELSEAYPGKIIYIFRRKNLEAPSMRSEIRKQYLESLNSIDCILDLDIKSQSEELIFIKTKGLKVKLITSYHNYHDTPSDGILSEIINQMDSYKPYIYKVSTLCNTDSDSLRLLRLLLALREQDKKRIILGMGEAGKITRIVGSLWGNEMLFAPESLSESSAPGQITREVVESILSKLSE